jgi:hypothetical protein
MTEEEILEYNKKCANFLYPNAKKEYEEGEISIEDGIFKKGMLVFEHYHIMKFHSDWNWIMEVVEAIENLGYFVMINKWTSTYTGAEKEGERIQITTVLGKYKKTNTVQAINEFFIWYNQNKAL